MGPAGPSGISAPAGSIKGTIAYSCTPTANLGGLLVHVPGRAFSVFTGADGAFQMDLVPPGTYKISIEGRQTFQVVSTVENVVVDMSTTNGVVDLHQVDLNDPESDRNNCGVCGNACSAGDVCVSGVCLAPQCEPGKGLCNGACVNLLADAGNCGVCGNSCGANGSCTAGQCVAQQCGAGTVSCNGACVNLLADARNCGVCGLKCGPNGICTAGACVLP